MPHVDATSTYLGIGCVNIYWTKVRRHSIYQRQNQETTYRTFSTCLDGYIKDSGHDWANELSQGVSRRVVSEYRGETFS